MIAGAATPPTIERPEYQAEHRAYESFTPATTTVPTGRPGHRRHEEEPLVPLGEALDALVGLDENWDSYGALPPSRQVLQHAWSLASMLVERGMPTPQVFPTRSGGIQLEWHVDRASLEWEIDASLTTGVFVFDDYATSERIDGELPQDLNLLAEALSRILVG